MSKESKKIKVTKAKGRPMLSWIGKKTLSRVTAFPAQLVERFDPENTAQPLTAPVYKENNRNWQNLLFHGDNKDALAWLLANGYRGKVDLIYIDPPFDSGADYVREVQLRGPGGRAKIEGEGYTLGEQIQYTDIWSNDNYLQFMYERLLLLKEMLTYNGVIYVHTDREREHQLRMLLDEVMGRDNFLNWIAYRTDVARGRKAQSAFFGNNLNILLAYARDPQLANERFKPLTYLAEIKNPREEGYVEDGGGFFSHSDSGSYTSTSLYELALENRVYGEFDLDHEKKELIPRGKVRVKYYLEKIKGSWFKRKYIDNIWSDFLGIANQPGEDTGYPTQKVTELVRRLVASSSKPGDLVLDCFIGSGTTAVVAQEGGRRWIGCDINKGAIQTTSKRLQTLITEQMEAKQNGRQLNHSESGEEAPSEPASLAFEVLRVNDYDLQIPHNEAVNLACEHVGVERIRTDAFFDGTRGDKLVKVIPFNHPLSPLDLEEIKRELEARENEQRDVVVICLGKELAIDAWLEEWNRHRPINKIEVIELRTDKRYRKFFEHKPASGEVEITRKGDKIHVEIKDFVSPSIIERLSMEASIFKVQITDFRAMIDCVMIDTAYNGEVFNIVLSDVPEKKPDLVEGRYELPAPKDKTKVAVKIIDMLGEEVLVTEEV